MRKNLRLLLTALLCAVMGQAWGQTPEVTLDFTSNDGWKISTTKVADETSYTNGNYTIKLSNGYYFESDNCLMMGKTGAYLTLPKFTFDVGTIVVCGHSGGSASVTQNFYVGDDAVSEQTTGAKADNTYIISDDYQAAGNIYTLKVTNNNNTRITKIKIYKVGSVVNEKPTPNMSFSETSFTIFVGDAFEKPTLTYDGDGTVTYSSDKEEVATVNSMNGDVTIVGEGTVNITANATETDNFNKASASYKIIVTSKKTHEIEDGTFDFTDFTDYGTGLTPNNKNGANDYILDDYTWTAGKVTLVSSGKYRWWIGTSNNDLRFYSNIVDEEQTSKMTISAPAGQFITEIIITGGQQFTANVGEYSKGKWTGKAQTVVLTYAANSGNVAVKTVSVQYGDGTVKKDPTFKFNNESYTVVLGDDLETPEYTYDGDGAITFASNNEDAVTVDPATGAVDIVGLGEAKITATAAETDTFNSATASYTINVVESLKQEPTLKFDPNYFTITIGEPFTAPTPTYNGDGTLSYESDNTDVAEVNATSGAVTIKAVGVAKITCTATETTNYLGKSASYTINVGEPQGTHEVVDGTFDFTDATAYGSGLIPNTSDEYIYKDVTWTAGNVTLISSGKFRWWKNNSGNSLRLYYEKNEETGTEIYSKLTISVPSGYTISKISFTFANSNKAFTADVGEYKDGIWTGNAQSVVLTQSSTSNIQIKTITVDYGKNRIDPQLAWSAETASATLGSSFTAPTLSKAQNYNGVINYSSSNESVATISAAGAVTIVGAGTTIITATAPSTDINIESSASYTLTVTDPNASDVTYDFTSTNDYGTELAPSSNSGYITVDYTWTNNPVSLVTSGKYRYWYNSNGNTLRLYSNVVDGQETTKLTFSVPEGKSITAIEFEVGVNDAFTADKGTFSGKSWSGDAQTVVLTLASGTPYISTINVSYKDASTTGLPGDADEDGSVSLADIMLVVDAILTDDTSHLNLTNADIDKSGKLSLSDIMGIVAIILAQ